MTVKVIVETDKCTDCPYCTNSNREHDCAFTPAPYPTRWWCKRNGMKLNESEVHKTVPANCPFEETNNATV